MTAEHLDLIDALLAEPAVTPADALAVRSAATAKLDAAERLRSALERGEARPTVEGALRLHDLSGQVLDAAWAEACLVADTAVGADVRHEAESQLRRIGEAATAAGLSRAAYDRLSAVDAAGASPDVRLMLERILEGFRAAGVDRDPGVRQRIAALMAEITAVGLVFGRNIRDGARDVEAGPGELAGLPEDVVARHPADGAGRRRLTTEWTDYAAVMAYADNEGLRRRMHEASGHRAWPENAPVLERLLHLRHELATLLGEGSYAHLATRTQMTRGPEQVRAFFAAVEATSAKAAERDRSLLLERWRRFAPEATATPPWSSAYVSRLLKQELHDFDPRAIRRHLPFNQVLPGVLALIEDLFGLEIRPWETPVWHETVQAFEAREGETVVGRFYLDMHPRADKYGHAKHLALRTGLAGRSSPVSVLICNFAPGGHVTGLMEHRELQTLLHEFGHLLHNLLSGGRAWHGQNYGRVEWDFIETPSQLLEDWAWRPEVLNRFAVDEHGEPPAPDLIARMNDARRFGEALGDRRQLAFAAASLEWHLKPPEPGALAASWAALFERYALAPAEAHGYAAFGHLSGYSALYYTYLWSRVIALDLQAAFAGPFDRETARRYRDTVLAPGGGAPAQASIEAFLGRPYAFDTYASRLRAA